MNDAMAGRSLLETTLTAAVKDGATVAAAGAPLRRLTHGVALRRPITHTDERGTVTELFDPRWGYHPDPLVFADTFSIRPSVVKGWNLHCRHEDRCTLLHGELELTLFDPRPDRPTCVEVCRIVLSERDRCVQYDHASPDKYRLPLETPLIPHRFPAGTIGG